MITSGGEIVDYETGVERTNTGKRVKATVLATLQT